MRMFMVQGESGACSECSGEVGAVGRLMLGLPMRRGDRSTGGVKYTWDKPTVRGAFACTSSVHPAMLWTGQHIHVLLLQACVLGDTVVVLVLVDHLAHVLHHELVGLDGVLGLEAPAPTVRALSKPRVEREKRRHNKANEEGGGEGKGREGEPQRRNQGMVRGGEGWARWRRE